MRRPTWFIAVAAVCVAPATALLGAIPAALDAAPAAAAVALAQPKADILVDADTGCVLTGDSIHTPLHPASTAKIMTALTAVERLPLDATVTADARAAAVETNKIGFAAGTQWPLSQMLIALMMVSANDAAYSIANTLGHGSFDTFDADVTATAHQLGLRDSSFNDPAGLDDAPSYKGGPTMSAYDLAVAARNALTVPAIAQWADTHLYEFTDPQGVHHRLINHNKMLAGGGFDYPGATGFKTGFTDRADHTLVATASRNGRNLIVVILGVPDSGYAEAASLLDAGFAMPANAPCKGEKLPAVAVSLYASRATDQAAFATLGNASKDHGGTGGTGGGGGGATAPASGSVPVFNSPPHGAAVAATTTSTASHRHKSGLLSLRNVIIAAVLAFAVVFFLRRRAVKRQRALRIARQRQRQAAMRSGGLTVVDGRYRTGTRIGPPVESHVHVHRSGG
jgi:D-alanyl-D-alanine carboxypeptidase (penicillin-binding protein 5/6)